VRTHGRLDRIWNRQPLPINRGALHKRDGTGLTDQQDFNYIELSGAIDYRDQEDNARAGGYYGLTWREHSDTDLDRYSFRAVDLLLQQFVPIFDKKRVFAVQARLLATATDDGQQVPFHFKPTLGGSTSHRGFNDYRFRDDSVVYVNAEYRWEAFSGLDMALFSIGGRSRRTSAA
jgi:outer membrane protein assembly factor BamA